MNGYSRPLEVYGNFNLTIVQPVVIESCRNLLGNCSLVRFDALSVECLECQPLVNVRLPRRRDMPTLSTQVKCDDRESSFTAA